MRGSPPRGRGRQPPSLPLRALRGLTPAWAGTARATVPSTSRVRAHPRVGGDGGIVHELQFRAPGSPPRGRGRRVQIDGRPGRMGLTPAWAGTALLGCVRTGDIRAHPRVGGDGVASALDGLREEGSPPRGRGRRNANNATIAASGLTPAWAGTAGARGSWSSRSGAHPRVGGDGIDAPSDAAGDAGSPPRGRGRQVAIGVVPVGVGLTPAWAGTAKPSPIAPSDGRAHPRVGGDGRTKSPENPTLEGSPPRGRGRRFGIEWQRPGDGLTPAWAGTACRQSAVRSPGGAHPRVGGDGLLDGLKVGAQTGSPPRGRGRLPECPLRLPRAGLTPAWAGTARRLATRQQRLRAHPRVGGDGAESLSFSPVDVGSPPRGRGRPTRSGLRDLGPGLTPAWAGTARLIAAAALNAGAHPRVGGDGTVRSCSASGAGGSPPRGRGRLRVGITSVMLQGLTPAWAGTAC